MSFTHIGTDQITNTSRSGSSISVTTAAGTTNDLRLFAFIIEANTTVSISSLSGGGVTTWTKAEGPFASTTGFSMELWYGSVTSAGTSLTVNLSGSLSSVVCDTYQIDFRSSNSGARSWSVVANNGINSGSATDCPFPNLTSVNAGELYFGLEWTAGNATNGTTPGFVYNQDSVGNPYVWNLNLAASTSYQPDETQSSSSVYFAIGAIFDDGSSSTPVPAYYYDPSRVPNRFVGPPALRQSFRHINAFDSTVIIGASGTGPLAFNGTASVVETDSDTGSGPLAFNGTASAVEIDSETGTSSIVFNGSGTANFQDPSDAYRPVKLSNRRVGPPVLRARFIYPYSVYENAANAGTLVSGGGPLSFNGSAVLTEADSGTGTGPLSFNGTVLAVETDSDTGTSSVAFNGTATANFQDPSDSYRPVRIANDHVGPQVLRTKLIPPYLFYENNVPAGSGNGALDFEGSGTASFTNSGGAGWIHIGTDQLAAGTISGSVFTHTTAVGTVGDLRVFALIIEQNTTVSISSLSGGGVATWTKAQGPYASPSGYSMELWYGAITGTGTSLTVTLSSSLSSAFCDRYQLDFRSNNTGPFTFTVKAHDGISSTAATDCPFPSLMSVNAGELYFGVEWTSKTAIDGSTSGFIYHQDSGGNPYVYNTNLAGSAAAQPDETQSSLGSYFAIGAIFDDGSNSGVNASGSGSLSLLGSVAPSVTEFGSGSGVLSFQGSANPLEQDTASGTGAVSFSGSGTAIFTYIASGSGPLAFSGSGTATVSASSISGNGALALTGSAAVVETDSDSGSGAIAFSGLSTALESDSDSGTGALALNGTATATLLYIVHGAPQASAIALSGSVIATEADHGAGTGALAFNGSGIVTTNNTTQIMGSGSLVFGASGTAAFLNVSPAILHIRVGDYGIVYSRLLLDQKGAPLDLSTATAVRLHVGNGLYGLILNVPATSFYASGHVTYTINANDLPYTGYFTSEWVVTLSNGTKTAPVSGYGQIIVHESLTLGSPTP